MYFAVTSYSATQIIPGLFYAYESNQLINYTDSMIIEDIGGLGSVYFSTSKKILSVYFNSNDYMDISLSGGEIILIFRIAEYHSANCDLFNIIFVSPEYTFLSFDGLPVPEQGYCTLSLIASIIPPNNLYSIHTAPMLRILALNYTGNDERIKMIRGVDPGFEIMEFNSDTLEIYPKFNIFGKGSSRN